MTTVHQTPFFQRARATPDVRRGESRHFIVMAGLALLLTGCDVYYGPVIVNETSRPIHVTATLSGSPVDQELQPGQAMWRDRKGETLETLTLAEGTEKKTFSTDDLRRLQSTAVPNERTAIELLGAGEVRIVPLSKLKRTPDKSPGVSN